MMKNSSVKHCHLSSAYLEVECVGATVIAMETSTTQAEMRHAQGIT